MMYAHNVLGRSILQEKGTPFFSVIITAYNSEKTLHKTLDSVLSQTYTNYELIIIDDASTDSTPEIIATYESKFPSCIVKRNEKNAGTANSRNTAIKIAKGAYIALLDSDDVWLREKLQIQHDCVTKTGCDICCTSYSFTNEQYKPIRRPYIVPDTIDYTALLKENHIGCSTVVINRNILQDVNYDNVFYHEDYALWLTLVKRGACICGSKDILMQYRVSKTARSYNKLNAAIHRFRIYRYQEKLNLFLSVKYFIIYAINGLRKHVL